MVFDYVNRISNTFLLRYRQSNWRWSHVVEWMMKMKDLHYDYIRLSENLEYINQISNWDRRKKLTVINSNKSTKGGTFLPTFLPANPRGKRRMTAINILRNSWWIFKLKGLVIVEYRGNNLSLQLMKRFLESSSQ